MKSKDSFRFYGRERELAEIDRFLTSSGAGFTFLRGRRRIGKTELLKKVRDGRPNTFFFMGRDDESNRQALRRFAREWDAFRGSRELVRLRESELNWDECFRAVLRAITPGAKTVPLLCIFDEIQWLSKKGSGFCGLLKEHWSEWKKRSAVKLILSGSSNGFFHRYADGENAVLRGLRTHATIWVRPFTLREVKTYYFPGWSPEEICLVYMMIGGVPYYLENVRSRENFMRAVNGSFFTRDTIFLEEVDSLLKLEAATTGARARIKEILACLGQDGATESSVIRKTGYGQDYVHKVIDRLIDYGIVHERRPLESVKSNRSGVRYYMDDFYLNFYFQVLRPMESKIRGNTDGLLFSSDVVKSKNGFYIPDFTGKAFELLIADILRYGCDDESQRRQGMYTRMSLKKGRYEWGTYWKHGETQIDLVAAGTDDRELRIIEVKWIGGTTPDASGLAKGVVSKLYDTGKWKSWRRSHYLVLSRKAGRTLTQQCAARGVMVVSIDDLF